MPLTYDTLKAGVLAFLATVLGGNIPMMNALERNKKEHNNQQRKRDGRNSPGKTAVGNGKEEAENKESWRQCTRRARARARKAKADSKASATFAASGATRKGTVGRAQAKAKVRKAKEVSNKALERVKESSAKAKVKAKALATTAASMATLLEIAAKVVARTQPGKAGPTHRPMREFRSLVRLGKAQAVGRATADGIHGPELERAWEEFSASKSAGPRRRKVPRNKRQR